MTNVGVVHIHCMYKIFTDTYKVKKDCSKKRKDQTVAMICTFSYGNKQACKVL